MALGVQQRPSHYEVLGVAPDAALEDIRMAYRAALLRLHPDKAGGTAACQPASFNSADAGFLSIQQAWEVLKDAASRSAYDQQLLGQAALKQVAVSAEVDLDDMECSTDVSDCTCTFSHPCRCGSRFLIREADLSLHASTLLVQCQGCSLVIMVLYTIAVP